MTDAEVRRTVPAWIWGGALLAASAVAPSALTMVAPGGGSVARVVISALFAASLVVFAFGVRGQGSIVDRRPGGVIALMVLAFVPPLIDLVTPTTVSEDQVASLTVVSYVQLAIAVAAALAAVVAIGRADAVPRPWRWAPAGGLAVIVIVSVVPQIIGVALQGRAVDEFLWLFSLGSLVMLAVPLALGILAMVLGARGIAAPSPQIYPPAA